MRPPKFKINVVDSPEKIHSIDKQYEILLRLILSLFAKQPDSYDVVHQDLFKLASKQGSMGPDLINERLLTTELCEAMQANDKVG
jgi:hypothetical protein